MRAATVLLLAGLACCEAFVRPTMRRATTVRSGQQQQQKKKKKKKKPSPREMYERTEAEKRKLRKAQDAANARARLEAEYARYRSSGGFDGRSLEAFAEKRQAVQERARRNGWVAFAVVIALNLRLASAPADVQRVARDANGICTSATADRFRPIPGTQTNGEPCMPFGVFVKKLLFEF